MEIYLAGTAVSLTVPLVDRSGNALDVASAEYRVVDQAGHEVVARGPLNGLDGSNAVVTIDAAVNQVTTIPDTITSNDIDKYMTREARTVELFLTDTLGNVTMIAKSYALETPDPLIVGLNSFQTFAQADLMALEIPNMTAWNAATEHEKITALIEARQRICQLNFWLLNSNINWGQDNLNYVPEGAYQSPYATNGNRMFIFNGNLSLLTPAQFSRLPVRFIAALRRAQVAEADQILGGSPVDARRQEGLMLESIGEVKQMFRPSKPLDLPISKRALRYLSQFVTFAKRIGRG